MSGLGGAKCPGQNGLNNEPSGSHMRHRASCHWKEICNDPYQIIQVFLKRLTKFDQV